MIKARFNDGPDRTPILRHRDTFRFVIFIMRIIWVGQIRILTNSWQQYWLNSLDQMKIQRIRHRMIFSSKRKDRRKNWPRQPVQRRRIDAGGSTQRTAEILSSFTSVFERLLDESTKFSAKVLVMRPSSASFSSSTRTKIATWRNSCAPNRTRAATTSCRRHSCSSIASERGPGRGAQKHIAAGCDEESRGQRERGATNYWPSTPRPVKPKPKLANRRLSFGPADFSVVPPPPSKQRSDGRPWGAGLEHADGKRIVFFSYNSQRTFPWIFSI